MGKKYLAIVGCMLVCSFYIRLALYISAYDMQHRSYGDRHRFAVVDRGDLGFWKYFILFPKNLKDKNKVFVITAEFEKRALVLFLRDIAIDIVLGYIFTVGDTYSLICMWFFVYTIVCIILNPIHSISDQINSLPKKIEINRKDAGEAYIKTL